MCLDSIDKEITHISGKGYKIVLKVGKSFATWDCFLHQGEKNYPLRHWKTDERTREIIGNYGGGYPSGFHICLDLEACQRMWTTHGAYYKREDINQKLVIIVCRFRNVLAEGKNYGCQTVVARDIFNIGEMK